AQMRLRGNGRSELSDDAAGLDDPLRRSYEGQQLLARVADVGRRGDLRRRVDEDRERELLLVPPAPVARRLRHACAGGDPFDRAAVDAPFGDERFRRFEDRLLAAAGPAGRRSVAVWFRSGVGHESGMKENET